MELCAFWSDGGPGREPADVRGLDSEWLIISQPCELRLQCSVARHSNL